MRKISILVLVCSILLSSCAPKISTSIRKTYLPLDYREEVKVLGLHDPIPIHSEEIGIVKIGDTGFSVNCDWDVVITKATLEARKIGGNAIKIINHIPPSAMGSSCHRITAKILKVEQFDITPAINQVDSTLLNADYALLHIYRPSGIGLFINYDLHLGDSVICRVSDNWKTTIKITKDGLNTLWSKTEAKEELPIKIKWGHEYYIRCSVSMGAFVGRPHLELVDNLTGKAEYEYITLKPKKK